MLKRSVSGPQQMNLNRIDFETGGSRTRKLACSFNIQLEKGRLSVLTTSVTVKNLLEVLQQDDGAAQLMRHNMYEIKLDNAFQLTITHITPVAEATEVIAEAVVVEAADAVEAE